MPYALTYRVLQIDYQHFEDDIFWCIFSKKIFGILIRNSLKFVFKSAIDNGD